MLIRTFHTLIVLLFMANLASCSQPQDKVAKKHRPIIVFETNQGEIEIELYREIAPKTVENFIGLVKKGYFDGIIFHRVIKGFMIQGGDPTGTGYGGESIWGGKFEDEIDPQLNFNRAGLLAMANAGPNTNGSQFFITTVPTPHLNGKHTIFGEITRGYDAVKNIENSKTGTKSRPLEKQYIKMAYVLKE